MKSSECRFKFPQLNQKVYGKDLVYLDNAATSLRPQTVIDKWNLMSSVHNSNLHRAVHKTASDATEQYELARDSVKDFINAKDRKEIIFTSGTTASINLLAYSYGDKFIGEGDEIIITDSEHHSNIVPWQMFCQRKKAILKHLPVDRYGRLQYEMLDDILTQRTKIVCVSHVSNVLGLINPIRKIADICHSKSVLLLVDGAQGIVHDSVDVQSLDCDFYVFSGHKIYAAPGTGVLYGKSEILESIPPFMGGGEMIDTVSWNNTTYAPLPMKFEAGTQNISGTPTFKEALNTALELRTVDDEITDLVFNRLMSDSRITLYGIPNNEFKKVPLFSFSVEGVHHEDLALILDKMGIAVRSGQMCAEPLMDRFGVTGMIRASFAPYNTVDEAEYFLQSLNKAIRMLQ